MNKLSASEAVWGFMGKLTSTKEQVFRTSGAVVTVIDLAAAFCEANGLAEPRDGWENNLVRPSDKGG